MRVNNPQSKVSKSIEIINMNELREHRDRAIAAARQNALELANGRSDYMQQIGTTIRTKQTQVIKIENNNNNKPLNQVYNMQQQYPQPQQQSGAGSKTLSRPSSSKQQPTQKRKSNGSDFQQDQIPQETNEKKRMAFQAEETKFKAPSGNNITIKRDSSLRRQNQPIQKNEIPKGNALNSNITNNNQPKKRTNDNWNTTKNANNKAKPQNVPYGIDKSQDKQALFDIENDINDRDDTENGYQQMQNNNRDKQYQHMDSEEEKTDIKSSYSQNNDSQTESNISNNNMNSFGKSFNKFTNGMILQSMRLSKEEIEKNNEYLNREMKERNSEEENDEDDDDEYEDKRSYSNNRQQQQDLSKNGKNETTKLNNKVNKQNVLEGQREMITKYGQNQKINDDNNYESGYSKNSDDYQLPVFGVKSEDITQREELNQQQPYQQKLKQTQQLQQKQTPYYQQENQSVFLKKPSQQQKQVQQSPFKVDTKQTDIFSAENARQRNQALKGYYSRENPFAGIKETEKVINKTDVSITSKKEGSFISNTSNNNINNNNQMKSTPSFSENKGINSYFANNKREGSLVKDTQPYQLLQQQQQQQQQSLLRKSSSSISSKPTKSGTINSNGNPFAKDNLSKQSNKNEPAKKPPITVTSPKPPISKKGAQSVSKPSTARNTPLVTKKKVDQVIIVSHHATQVAQPKNRPASAVTAKEAIKKKTTSKSPMQPMRKSINSYNYL